MVLAIKFIIFFLPLALSQYHSPSANAAPSINVDVLFQYTTSRNQKVISQAVEFVVSMQTAPTCTRMAASHLMNECKHLEYAPDFAKSRPEAYLDKVKTEYAAKLAVCELLSAQPLDPVAPPHCEILVPSSSACSRGGNWWYPKPEQPSEKQCYPQYKDHQYTQCLKALQSTPQFWTSFSNARQNAVVMCQASRDAIEREDHLETFKNLTQILGAVTSTMQKTTEEYESLIRDQQKFAEEARESSSRLKEDIQDVQDKAIATVGALDNKFHTFMQGSMAELITALADNQSAEIVRIRQDMQEFSETLMSESSQLARHFSAEIQDYHERSLHSLQASHQAQVESYSILSGQMHTVQGTANHTIDIADTSLTKIESIAQRMDTFETQTEHIAEGFAFLSGIPGLVTVFVRGFVAAMGATFLLAILYKLSPKLAACVCGVCSSAYLLYSCDLFDWLEHLLNLKSNHFDQTSPSSTAGMTPTHKGVAIMLLLWIGAYPIVRLNAYIGHMLATVYNHGFTSLWLQQYQNDGGIGLLPSIEVPAQPSSRKHDAHNSSTFTYHDARAASA